MLRNMEADTIHQIEGNMSISTYISQVSSRAMYSIRVGPKTIAPLAIGGGVDLNAAVANTVVVTAVRTPSLKTEFLVWCYVFQNWHNADVVNSLQASTSKSQKKKKNKQINYTDYL